MHEMLLGVQAQAAESSCTKYCCDHAITHALLLRSTAGHTACCNSPMLHGSSMITAQSWPSKLSVCMAFQTVLLHDPALYLTGPTCPKAPAPSFQGRPSFSTMARRVGAISLSADDPGPSRVPSMPLCPTLQDTSDHLPADVRANTGPIDRRAKLEGSIKVPVCLAGPCWQVTRCLLAGRHHTPGCTLVRLGARCMCSALRPLTVSLQGLLSKRHTQIRPAHRRQALPGKLR